MVENPRVRAESAREQEERRELVDIGVERGGYLRLPLQSEIIRKPMSRLRH